MLINNANLAALYTGFSAAFQGAFSGVEPMYSSVATTVPSTTKSNTYGWLGKMPNFRKWLGDRVVNSIASHGYTIINEPYELTIGVDRDDIEDDNLGIYTPMFAGMGDAAAKFPDTLVWPMLPGGFSTPCYDGQFFFDTDHPVLDANGDPQSVSNMTAGAETPWYLLDVSRPLLPIIYQSRRPFNRIVRMDDEKDENVFRRKEYQYGVDGRCNVGFGLWQMAHGSKATLNPANYEAARVAMHEQKGDFGRPLGIMPSLLVVPPSLEGAANEIVQSKLVNGGETNKWAGTAKVIVSPWL